MRVLAVGQIIDRYQVQSVIGTGGTAVVYRVKHVSLGTPHALKVLSVSSDVIRDRMLQEGRVQAALRHPNVVAVTDVISVDGDPGLLMEIIEGPSLQKALKEFRLPLEAAEALFLGVVNGVRAAHAQGLVHRDLKPANVLLAKTHDGFVPKVTDFGLAKVLEADEIQTGHTRSGMAMGTPAYMAAEQIRDAKGVDQRADIFSLGCILYELVCGQRAFPGDDAITIYNAVLQGEYIPPRNLRPDLPDRIDLAIRGALTLDRDVRIPDCDTLLGVLQGRRGWDFTEGDHFADPDPPTIESSRPANPDAPELVVAAAKADEEASGAAFPKNFDSVTDVKEENGDPLYATIGAAGAHIAPYNLPDPNAASVTGIVSPALQTVVEPKPPPTPPWMVFVGVSAVFFVFLFGGLFGMYLYTAVNGTGAQTEVVVEPPPVAPVAPATVETPPATPATPSSPPGTPGGSPGSALPGAGTGTPPAGGPSTSPGNGSPTTLGGGTAPAAGLPTSGTGPANPATNTSAVVAPPVKPKPAAVTVKLLSKPPTASLWIDGVDRGRTPAKLELTPGKHQVEVRSGDRTGRFAVTVTEAAEQRWCWSFAEEKAYDAPCP